MSDSQKDLPQTIAWPPLVFLGALGVGLWLHWLLPVQPLPLKLSRWLGAVPCVVSGVINFWACGLMLSAGTSIRPTQPVTALVQRGPFRFSRNPLYLSLTLLYVGITLQFGALWPWLTLLPMLGLVHWKIILREEQYLEAKFGDEYRAYKTRVRRWI